MSKDAETAEATITDEQRDHWNEIVGNWRSHWGEEIPEEKVYILAVADRLVWLETERVRLVEVKTALLKDRDEWREAARAEAFLHDTVIKEHQSALASTTALRAELAQSRAEQQRVETALAEALRQLWQAKEVMRRGEPAIRFAEAYDAWDKASRETPRQGTMTIFLALMKPFEVEMRNAFKAYRAALASPDASRKEG